MSKSEFVGKRAGFSATAVTVLVSVSIAIAFGMESFVDAGKVY